MDSETRNKKVKLMVELEVTPAQALALKAMFEYWNELASQGSSRRVAFFVDGDGNFRPNCKLSTDQPDNFPLPLLTDPMRAHAVVDDKNGHRAYDFDPIAWIIRED